MKLLIISHLPEHHPTDASRVFRAIGAELQKREHTVHYFIRHRHKAKNAWPIPPKRLPLLQAQPSISEWLHAIRIAPSIAQACRQVPYQALLCPGRLGWCLSAFRNWMLPPHTKIISWHSAQDPVDEMTDPETVPITPPAKLARHLRLWMQRYILQTEDACLVTSTEERAQLLAQYPQAVEKIRYLPNGVDAHFYYPNRYAETSPLTEDKPIKLLYVGGWPPKGLQGTDLGEAFAQLKRKYPALELTLANTRIAASAVLLDFPIETHEALTIWPLVNEAALVAIYRSHDIFILPSPMDGLPLSVLEAMASALPVVAPQVFGMKDILQHYENGLLIPHRDVNALVQAVSHLVEHPELRQELGMAAYETVSLYYTWRQVSDIFEQHLLGILETDSDMSDSAAPHSTDADATNKNDSIQPP